MIERASKNTKTIQKLKSTPQPHRYKGKKENETKNNEKKKKLQCLKP